MRRAEGDGGRRPRSSGPKSRELDRRPLWATAALAEVVVRVGLAGRLLTDGRQGRGRARIGRIRAFILTPALPRRIIVIARGRSPGGRTDRQSFACSIERGDIPATQNSA